MAHSSESICFLCTFLLIFCHLQYFCSGRDNISSADNWISEYNGGEIVSAGDVFRLGFLTPIGSSGRYVGICYSKSPEVIVWVANRDKPIPSSVNGTFGIDIKRGNLEVSDSSTTRTYFSTDVGPRPNINSRTAKLEDSGNLVLIDDLTGEILWESFKHPTDTFLPGMKMDGDLNLTSWKSDEDPAPGNFFFKLDEDEEGGGYKIMKSEFHNIVSTYWKSGGESTTSFMPVRKYVYGMRGFL